MGRKKKKKAVKPTKKSFNISPEMMIIIMIIVGIMSGVLIYTGAGQVGAILSPVLGGLVGIIKYVIPIGIIVMALSLIKEDSEYVSTKVIQFLVFIVCVSVVMHVNQFSKLNMSGNATFEEVVNEAYKLGTMNKGGGAIGAIVATPLMNLLGSLGTTILTIAIAIVTCMYIVGVNPVELLVEFVDGREDRREEKRARREEQRQAFNERREERKKNRTSTHTEVAKEKDNAPMKDQVDLIQDEIVINHFNDHNNEEKKHKLGLFGKKDEEPEKNKKEQKQNNPDELENIFKEVQEEKEEKTKAVLQLDHYTHTVDDENYEAPPVELLKQGSNKTTKGSKKALTDTATKLQKTLYSFGVSAKVENVSVGPVITRYELKPAEGVRVSKIAKLADDIALNLAAESIRIEAPIPGKQAVGIEIPNKEKEIVPLRDIIDSEEFNESKSKLSFALGKSVSGDNVITDIAKMPHVLIAGSTGSGKSVCINTLITSILYKAKPSEVKLIMVDPKVVELSVYNGIPHLLIPVVTDPKKAAGALAWAVQEMVNRYSLFAQKNVRDIKGYNAQLDKEGVDGKLPQIVIIVDELADLMMVSPKDVEDAICRLAQMARAAGMHLVIATQRPSVDVITGIIKANIPSRIAFAVSSQVDSRTILDSVGAEKLLGKGDMLFYPLGASKPVRLQGAFISENESQNVIDFVKSQVKEEVKYEENIMDTISKVNMEKSSDEDDLLSEAIEFVVESGQGSASMLQRKFKIGFNRAARLIDSMEERGIVGPNEGSKPRKVLMSKQDLQNLEGE